RCATMVLPSLPVGGSAGRVARCCCARYTTFPHYLERFWTMNSCRIFNLNQLFFQQLSQAVDNAFDTFRTQANPGKRRKFLAGPSLKRVKPENRPLFLADPALPQAVVHLLENDPCFDRLLIPIPGRLNLFRLVQ